MAKYIERLKEKVKIKKFDSNQPIGAWIFVVILNIVFQYHELSNFPRNSKIKKTCSSGKSWRTLRKITGTFQSFKKISSKTT